MNSWSFYVVDFYLPEYNVVCEIDGDSHYNDFSRDDDKRTLILKNQNKVHEVFRFWNEDVRDAHRKCAESLDFLLANL